MSDLKIIPTIGLFGTCGRSKWRDHFIQRYETLGINYFNPHVPNWDPSLAEIEADHLINDEIILFPITSETYATGSLAETGFSVLSTVKSSNDRYVIIMIDQHLDEDLTDENLTKESLRGRALVKAHLEKLNLKNVFFVNTLSEMYLTSIDLYNIVVSLKQIRKRHKGQWITS